MLSFRLIPFRNGVRGWGGVTVDMYSTVALGNAL